MSDPSDTAPSGSARTGGHEDNLAEGQAGQDMLTSRLKALEDRIRAWGREPGDITVVGVTKGFGPELVETALRAGLADLGENYAPELLLKARSGGSIRWHFLGAIQRNKVRTLCPVVSVWHSVTRLEEGAEIARHAPGARVFIQANFTGLAQRRGVAPTEVARLVEGLSAYELDIAGLMTMPAGTRGPPAREVFARAADLARGLGLRGLSMGMSTDVQDAVVEGSTVIRIGQGLFGPRPRVPVPRSAR
ncbi:MAG: YggS family pyridoxal phosphate enzyme [Acidimicrobiales bacterium]